MDDTLYDEIEYCKSGFTATAKYIVDNLKSPEKLTTEQVFNSLWVEFNTGNQTKTFNAALDKSEIKYDVDTIKNLISVYRQHKPAISLPRQSKEILDALSEKYSLALLTDGFLPAQRLKIGALGIEKYFKKIVCTEELGREFWKPSPVGFEKIMENFGETAENCIYVADNAEKDFMAPNELGMQTIQLLRAKKVHKGVGKSENAAAKHKIYDILELPGLIEEL
jgi:putative hydrolase of the HAD superfamily